MTRGNPCRIPDFELHWVFRTPAWRDKRHSHHCWHHGIAREHTRNVQCLITWANQPTNPASFQCHHGKLNKVMPRFHLGNNAWNQGLLINKTSPNKALGMLGEVALRTWGSWKISTIFSKRIQPVRVWNQQTTDQTKPSVSIFGSGEKMTKRNHQILDLHKMLF